MASALFVKSSDIAKHTALNGNVDADKFTQFVKIAQDISLQNILGTDLYEAMDASIVASTLAGNYVTLNTTYITPFLIHSAMLHYLPFAAYQVANRGIFKGGSENSSAVEKNEVDYLVEAERDISEHYAKRLIDYLCNNNTLFPEYSTNSNGDMNPDKDVLFSGWVL
jgi:hypothetical protein